MPGFGRNIRRASAPTTGPAPVVVQVRERGDLARLNQVSHGGVGQEAAAEASG